MRSSGRFCQFRLKSRFLKRNLKNAKKGYLPYCCADGALTKLTVFCSALSSFSYVLDLALDIYNGYNYTQKPMCNAKANMTSFTSNSSDNTNSTNSTTGWVAHLGEPMNEMDIPLNYQLYAAACFLFALGLILSIFRRNKTLTVPAYIQSFWSYYMYWVEQKQRYSF